MTHESPLMTNAEAAKHLRLDDDFPEMGNAIEALHRLVRAGELMPIRGIGKTYKWARSELDRFIAEKAGASVPRTEGIAAQDGQEGRFEADGHLDGHSNGLDLEP